MALSQYLVLSPTLDRFHKAYRYAGEDCKKETKAITQTGELLSHSVSRAVGNVYQDA